MVRRCRAATLHYPRASQGREPAGGGGSADDDGGTEMEESIPHLVPGAQATDFMGTKNEVAARRAKFSKSGVFLRRP